jgi:hypothetical protein
MKLSSKYSSCGAGMGGRSGRSLLAVCLAGVLIATAKPRPPPRGPSLHQWSAPPAAPPIKLYRYALMLGTRAPLPIPVKIQLHYPRLLPPPLSQEFQIHADRNCSSPDSVSNSNSALKVLSKTDRGRKWYQLIGYTFSYSCREYFKKSVRSPSCER